MRDRSASEPIARGHPWVWRDAIAEGLDGAVAGDEVQLVTSDRAPLGRGLADPGSPIAVRVWTTGRAPIDDDLWKSRARGALALRERLVASPATNAYRVLHGEGDRMPGMVVDRYDAVAIVRTDGQGAARRVGDLADALWPELHARGVQGLAHRTPARAAGEAPQLELLRGAMSADPVLVTEHGIPFLVDVRHGQKTGAFLDQRDNRRRVGELARDRRVLNLYSYAGGFSLHAARGGARQVTSVDVAAAAHATAQASFRAAAVDPSDHAFVTADVRAFLDRARRRGESWDLIVSDPPSFAPSERARARALTAYRALHRGCADVLAPGGILCAASCSSHVDANAFLSTLDDSALGGRTLAVLELRGAGADHPTLAAFPEGRYLKFVVLG